MKKAFVFPGQGAQFPGMGKDMYDASDVARIMFDKANEVLGYSITDIMFDGTEDDLRQTRVTQPAVFLHSVISAACLGDGFAPDMVAGHSLGEFSALTAAGALTFEDGLRLVYARAMAMQKACEAKPSTMAAIILDSRLGDLSFSRLGNQTTKQPDDQTTKQPILSFGEVERICREVSSEGNVVVPANYNTPVQLVISGDCDAVNEACVRIKEAGAKRALPLKVGGAFHSPLMQPAKEELQKAIETVELKTPRCPIYQNVDALPHTDASEIKANLIAQLTSPVRWTEQAERMIADGATEFIECGPGKALCGMMAKINREISCTVVG